jgi:hypothetical protein
LTGATRTPVSAGGTDLLTLVGGDLTGCRLERRSGVHAVVTPPAGAPFDLEVRTDRRRLMTLLSSAVSVGGAPTGSRARVVLRHTGRVRRTGLEARIHGADDGEAAALRDRLLAEGELEAASIALDFTSFVVAPSGGRWRATLELMGGSHVRMMLPPTRSYVRLAADQRDALLATVAVLQRRLSAP